MCGLHRVEVLRQCLFQSRLGAQRVVAADVLIAVEVCGYCQIYCSLVGTAYLQYAVAAAHASALYGCRSPAGKCNLAFLSFVPSAYAAQHNLVAFRLNGYVLLRRCHLRVAGYHALLACSEVYGYYVSVERRNVFSLICYAVACVSRYGAGRVKAQFAVVVGVFAVAREVDIQVAKRLIRHTAVGVCLHVCRGQVLRLLVFAFPHQLSHLRQILLCLRVGVVVGPSCPYCLLVELQTLRARRAVYHGAQAAVAYRQSLCPCVCRSVIPQHMLVLGHSLCCCHQAYGRQQCCL